MEIAQRVKFVAVVALLPLLLAAAAGRMFLFAHLQGRQVLSTLTQRLHDWRLVDPESGAETPSTGNSGGILRLPEGYHLTFEDNFTDLNIADRDGVPARWYSQTIQCCMYDNSHPSTPTHMALSGAPPDQRPFALLPGKGMAIELKKVRNEWYSGVIATVDRHGHGFAQQYGYFELTATFPDASGTWPAFWLLNQQALTAGKSPAEIDVVESYMMAPNYINTTLHDWAPPVMTLAHHLAKVDRLSEGLHTFSMLWTESTMTFACDGKIYFSMPTPHQMQQPFYPIIDLGLGGGWPTDKTPERSQMIVRSVKVYAMN